MEKVSAARNMKRAGIVLIAVVGREFAAYLLTGKEDGLEIRIREGSVMCIRFDGAPAPGTGKLRWLLTPEALRFQAT
jgi:hypothetical protein